MAKFVFRLQSFLNLKEKMEEQKKLEYGKAVQAVEDEKRIKREMEEKRIQLINELRNKIIENITPTKYREYNQYLIFIEEEILLQQKRIEKAEEVAEAKRLELVESVKERKMLETLREKDLEAYKEEEKLNDQKLVDEIVSFQYNNNNTDEGNK